jgi:hypothetical protein
LLIHYITVESSNASDTSETYDVSRGQQLKKPRVQPGAGERGQPVVCPPLVSRYKTIEKEENS